MKRRRVGPDPELEASKTFPIDVDNALRVRSSPSLFLTLFCPLPMESFINLFLSIKHWVCVYTNESF